MRKKKKNKQDKPLQAQEPQASYGSGNKTIRFFSSFDEADEYDAKESAALTYEQRMLYAEILRKRIFHKYLLPNGKWKPMENTFSIMPPHVRKIS